MSVKNLFIASSLVALAFGLPLIFAPQSIVDIYAVDKVTLSGVALLVCREFGGFLTAFAVGGFMALKAAQSYGRRSLLAITTINGTIITILNILGINNGVQNNKAWGIVIGVGALAVWAGYLLSKEEIEKAHK